MKKKHIAIFGILLLLVSAASYRFGIKVTKTAWNKNYASVQAMLAFNHLKKYESLSECLNNGKYDVAIKKIENSIITEKELISKFLQTYNDAMMNEYISIRYPQGIESLRNFKSNREGRWTVAGCK